METMIKKAKFCLLDILDEVFYIIKKYLKIVWGKVMDIVKPKLKEFGKACAKKAGEKLLKKLKNSLKKLLVVSAALACLSFVLLLLGKKK